MRPARRSARHQPMSKLNFQLPRRFHGEGLIDARSIDAGPMQSETAEELCFTSARELARRIRSRELSARDLMAAHLARIRRINPQINAIVAKLDDDRCLELAEDADRLLERGEAVGPLHGLPIAFKDLEPAVGFP